jgi:N6-adenosine-specific RNA methylase IME4
MSNDIDKKKKKKRIPKEQKVYKFEEIYPPIDAELQKNDVGIIYVDPPWAYRPCGRLGGLAVNEYPCLNLEQLKMLKEPIDKMASKNCALLMWTTGPKIMEAGELIEHWGFDYKTVFNVWLKTTKNDLVVCGLGFYTRSCCEFLLLATRGNMKTKVMNRSISQIVIDPVGVHSEKPKKVSKIITDLFDCSDFKKVELFARDVKDGWYAWGNDPSVVGHTKNENTETVEEGEEDDG